VPVGGPRISLFDAIEQMGVPLAGCDPEADYAIDMNELIDNSFRRHAGLWKGFSRAQPQLFQRGVVAMGRDSLRQDIWLHATLKTSVISLPG
jgi:hypothetical protein